MDQFTASRLEVFLVSLPTRAVLTTATDNSPPPNRELVFVRITDHDGAHGWGECSALTSRGYANEWARGAFGLLASGFGFEASQHPMAYAALEMARLDLSLRSEGKSLAQHLGANRSRIPAGAVIGLAPVGETLEVAAQLCAEGYNRLKLKIAPGDVSPRVVAVREAFGDIELHVDANASLGSKDLDELAGLDVAVIEQPFAVGEVALTSELAANTSAQILADEETRAVHSVAELSHFDGLVIKPGPLGGIAKALELAKAGAAIGLTAAVGGMLESGLGRHTLTALASLDLFSVTGDVSPAGRWLETDPWQDLEMTDGQIAVPASPGIAPDLNLDVLEAHTVAKAQVPLHL